VTTTSTSGSGRGSWAVAVLERREGV